MCRCGRRPRRRKPIVATSRSGVPAVLSHKAGEVAFVPCSLPRRGQLPPPTALLKVELRPSGTTPFTAGLHHCSSCPHHSMWIFLYFFAPHIPLLASTYCICDEFMSHQLVLVILFQSRFFNFFATGMLISILVKLHKMIRWSKGCKLHFFGSSNVASKLKPG